MMPTVIRLVTEVATPVPVMDKSNPATSIMSLSAVGGKNLTVLTAK
jgi:hypothetical protein